MDTFHFSSQEVLSAHQKLSEPKANALVRFAPVVFMVLPFLGVSVFHDLSLSACDFVVQQAAGLYQDHLPSIVLLGAVLSGCSNKLTDLIDDEGLLSDHQGSKRLFALQIVLKTLFPAFFLLMFPFNHFAAAILAATYMFAWVIRGKVGVSTKPLETVICVLFLPPAWSLVGGHLLSSPDFRHTFTVVLLAHDVYLRIVRKCELAKQFPSTRDLVTEMGVFRYAPVLALGGCSGASLLGALIVALDNLAYFTVKRAWVKAHTPPPLPAKASGNPAHAG